MAHLVFFGGLGMLAGALARWCLGRLRRGARVDPPWCEVLVGALWAASGYWWASDRLAAAWLPLLLGVGWLGVAAGAVDLLHRRLPDALTLPALPVMLLLAVPLGVAAVPRAVVGAVLLAGGYLAVRLAAPRALGAGDVKLAAPVGAALGAVSWSAPLVGALGAAVFTLALALAWALARMVRPASLVGPPGQAGDAEAEGAPGSAAARAGPAGGVRNGPAGGVPHGAAGGVPHGPALLGAAWLVLAAAGTGLGGFIP